MKITELFFDNINRMRKAGCSFTLEVTPNDELIPHIDELRAEAKKYVGADCHVTIVYRKDIHPGFWAKLLCRFVHVTPAGPGAGTPHKMQLIIMICGLPRVLLAAFCSAVTKLFGKKGVFYKVCGHEVDGIDGLIDYDISFKEYVDYGILNPENPSGVCDEIYEKTGVKAMIIDASDIDCVILGKCRNVTLTDEQLCEIVRDNPAGQEGQCTPFILIRKKA